MKREDFQQGLMDYDMAQISTSLSQEAEAQPAPVEGEAAPASPPEGDKPVQVAGMGRSALKGLFGDEMGDLVGKNAHTLVHNKPPKPKPRTPTPEEMADTLNVYAMDKNVPTGFVGPMPLSQMSTPDEIGQLVENMGMQKLQAGDSPRSWDELQARTSNINKVMEELRPITEGRQGGVLSDVQMTGVSRLVATAYDDVSTYSKMINSGDATPEILLRLQNAKATYELMHAFMQGNKSEVARSLNSIKLMSTALDGKDMKAYERLVGGEQGSKLTETIKQYAQVISDKVDSTGDIGKALKWSYDHMGNGTRIAVEYWKNNQLSGMGTHVVNNASIATYNLYENIAVKPLAAGIGRIRAGGGAGKDRVYGSEVVAPLYSAYAGLRGSMGLFFDSLVSNKSAFKHADKVESQGQLAKALGPSTAGRAADVALTGSFRVLSATDDAWRGVTFVQELYDLSSRQASREGLTGKAHIKRMNELIEDPPYEMYEASSLKASQMTFTDIETRGSIAHMSKAMRVMVGEVPSLQFIIPYINTPSRLLHVASEMSVLAPFSKRLREDFKAGGAKADIAIAKMISGMGMTVLWWQLYESGLMTGGGPDDFAAQDMLKKEGWQPLAIQGGEGKMYGMERMDPFGQSIKISEAVGTVLGYFDKAKYAANPEDKERNMALAMLHLTQYQLDPTWMGQAKDFLGAFEGTVQMEKFAARTLSGFVPYHAGIKSYREATGSGSKPQVANDKIISDVWDMTKRFAVGNMPEGWRAQDTFVRPKRWWDGTVALPQQGGFAHAALPWGPTSPKAEDPRNKALFENRIVPREPSSLLTFGPMTFSLLQLDPTEQIYDMYIKSVGEGRVEALDKVMGKSRYEDAEGGPNGVKAVMLRKGIASGTKIGLKNFLKDLELAVERNPDLYDHLAQEFGSDPKDFIKSAYESIDGELKGAKKAVPTREKLEYPIPEM